MEPIKSPPRIVKTSSDLLSFLPWQVIVHATEPFEVDPFLVAAFVLTESGGNQYATRFEPNYHWLYKPEECAKRAGTTLETEKIHQQTSWGYMQLMGGVLRELQFKGGLPGACDEFTNISYGAAKLKRLIDAYVKIPDAISAYNQGSPRRQPNGQYVNQPYVSRVLDWWARLSADGKSLIQPPEGAKDGKG